MKIAVIGAGYVGLTQAIGLASYPSVVEEVTVYEKDHSKLTQLRDKGQIPFHEKDLQEVFNSHRSKIKFRHAHELGYDGIETHDLVFLAVGTPASVYDGSANLTALTECIEQLYKQKVKAVVIKSTVPPGTATKLTWEIANNNPAETLEIISNPEFLREGSALEDFHHPDRVVLGGHNGPGMQKLMKLYGSIYEYPIIIATDNESAELAKYASNAFLALKVTYINEIANLCRDLGANVKDVAEIMGLDPRIGEDFLKPGPGFGGSCFPKDVKALIRVADTYGSKLSLVEQLQHANDRRLIQMADDISMYIGHEKNKIITILGLGFKAGTDDTRGAPASIICPILKERGYLLNVFDPLIKKCDFGKVCDSLESSLKDSRAAIILSECEEFRALNDFDLENITVIDLRNMLNPEDFGGCEFYNLG